MAGTDFSADRYHLRYDARWRRPEAPEPVNRGEAHPYLGDEEAVQPCGFPVGGQACGAEMDTPVHDPALFRRFA